tara:strand:- start:206 stop:463 length:258 start_codon:yes stop_codon:yes gene_type:complete
VNNKISRSELCSLIEEILELEVGTVTSESTDWYEEWDSLGHLSILVALDKKLGGKCKDIRELGTAVSIDKIFNILIDNQLADTLT